MSVSRLLVSDAIGQFSALALSAEAQPVGLFVERWSTRGRRARWGDVVEARLHAVPNGQGGGFATLQTGETAFIQAKHLDGRTEGEALHLRIVAEARRGKQARAVPCEANHDDGLSAFERWRGALPNGPSIVEERGKAGNELIAAAIEESLSPSVTLPGGGRLHIARTPALTALDVDTAGRIENGRAAVRALSVNMDAAAEAARQLALRGLGGAAVLDCTSALARRDGPAVKAAFLKTYRSVSNAKAEALAPSPFGLMEVALEWRTCPIEDLLLDGQGKPTAETHLLAAIQTTEREAQARGGASLHLVWPDTPEYVALAKSIGIEAALASRYGARIKAHAAPVSYPEVS